MKSILHMIDVISMAEQRFELRLARLVTSIKALVLLSSTLLVSFLPSFDASPVLGASSSPFARATLRWDAIHFANVAHRGYTYEHELAFSPATALLHRLPLVVAHVVSFVTCTTTVLVFLA